MSGITYYNTGTASVANGATAVTGSGTAWLDVLQAGDLFFDPAQAIPPARIASVESNTALTLAWAWLGTSLTDDPYEVQLMPDSVRTSERTRELLEELSVVQANGRGLFYTFATATADADPGSGVLRLNNASPVLATAAYLDDLDANGAITSGVLDTWDDDGETGGRGQLWIRGIADPSSFRAYEVTGSVVDGTGYRKLTLVHIGGSGGFSDGDELMVTFVPIGATGAAGADGADGYLADAGDLGDALGAFGLAANWGLAASVAANALTIALKGADGNDPSAANPVVIPFRSATAGTGTPSVLTITAATSLVIPDTATMGTVSGQAARLWVVGFNNAGALVPAVINCLSGTSIYPLRAQGIASTSTMNVVADNAHAFVGSATLTDKAYTVLGYVEITEATAGTWATAPSKVEIYRGGKLPGDVVQVARTETGAVATGSTTIPIDDTIPQNTEGAQFMSQAITPTSAANVRRTEVKATLAPDQLQNIISALFVDSVAGAVAATVHTFGGTNYRDDQGLVNTAVFNTSSQVTMKFRAGLPAAGTITFNGAGGARTLGGVHNSYIQVSEIMA